MVANLAHSLMCNYSIDDAGKKTAHLVIKPYRPFNLAINDLLRIVNQMHNYINPSSQFNLLKLKKEKIKIK